MLLISAFTCAQEPGRIVFYRTRKDSGKANYSQPVLCDAQKIGQLHRAHFFIFVPAPGPHEYRSSQTNERISVDVKPGETAYVMAVSTLGKLLIHARLISVLPGQGADDLRELEYAKPGDIQDERILRHPPPNH